MMNSTAPDNQLEYELQDLYISSKHWLTDVSFLSDEIRFFKDLMSKYFAVDRVTEQGPKMHHCRMMLYQQQERIISLQIKITAYLNFLAPYIGDQNQKIGIDLIEKHSQLEEEISTLFETFRLLKTELFSLTEIAM